jgi:hypothetical protein
MDTELIGSHQNRLGHLASRMFFESLLLGGPCDQQPGNQGTETL